MPDSPEPKRYLIAIGSPSAGEMQLRRLENVEADISRVNRIFTDGVQGYQRVLEDQLSIGSTAPDIQKALSDWFGSAHRRSSDYVIVYYAGHAGESGNLGLHYLYTNGSQPNSLPRTAIETGSLIKWFFEGGNDFPKNVLLILDVCYAGHGITESILNLAKARAPQIGANFWILGSADSLTEASDGGFVDALESVLTNQKGIDETPFLNPITLRDKINEYLKSKESPQKATVSILDNSSVAAFIRNPSQLSSTSETRNVALISNPVSEAPPQDISETGNVAPISNPVNEAPPQDISETRNVAPISNPVNEAPLQDMSLLIPVVLTNFKSIFFVIVASCAATATVFLMKDNVFLKSIDNRAYDYVISNRSDDEALDPRIAIVEITSEDMKNPSFKDDIHDYMISDKLTLKIVSKIQEFKPKLIGIDLYLGHSKNKYEENDYMKLLQHLNKVDDKEKNNSITVVCEKSSTHDPSITSGHPPPVIKQPKINFSFSNFLDESIVRGQPLYSNDGIRECDYPHSFSFELSLQYLHKIPNYSINDFELYPEDMPKSLKFGRSEKGIFTPSKEKEFDLIKHSLNPFRKDFKHSELGLDKFQKPSILLLNYRSKKDVAVKISLKELFYTDKPILIKDRIILVGYTSEIHSENTDLHDTPYGMKMPGVIIHAHMISQILSRLKDNRSLIYPFENEIILILFVEIAIGLVYLKMKNKIFFTFISSFLVALVHSLAYRFFLTQVVFSSSFFILPFSSVLITITTTSVVLISLQFLVSLFDISNVQPPVLQINHLEPDENMSFTFSSTLPTETDHMISTTAPIPSKPIEIFISYSHKDDDLRQGLDIHLSNLRRQGKISAWHDRAIEAGTVWETEKKSRLESAQIVLLLISSDFMHSDYCYDIEMQRAVQRHDAGHAHVIPVIIRPTDWTDSPFSKFQVLPTNKKPVTQWDDRDTAFLDVVQGIRQKVDSLTNK